MIFRLRSDQTYKKVVQSYLKNGLGGIDHLHIFAECFNLVA